MSYTENNTNYEDLIAELKRLEIVGKDIAMQIRTVSMYYYHANFEKLHEWDLTMPDMPESYFFKD